MQNWDHMCADCHSTNLRKEFDDATQTFSTAYSEINVSCESCHGPGRKHIELARSGKGFKNMPNFALVDINSTNVAQIESCAKCHARRGFVHPGHHAGNSFGPFLTRGSAALVSGYASAYLPCRWAN